MAHATERSLSVQPAPPLYGEIDGLEVEVDLRSLSTIGCFIHTTDPLVQGAGVELFLRSPVGTETMQCTVHTVVSCTDATRLRRSPGFELRFEAVTDGQELFLEQTSSILRRAIADALAAPALPRFEDDVQPAAASGTPPQTASTPPRASVPVKRASQRPRGASSHVPQRSLRPAEPDGPSPEAPNILRALRERIARESNLDAWRILGVEANASVNDAKRAFLRGAKERHPHTFARHRSAEVSRAATELFILYKRAYSDFCRDVSRRQAAQPRAARRPRGTQPYQQDHADSQD